LLIAPHLPDVVIRLQEQRFHCMAIAEVRELTRDCPHRPFIIDTGR
jgi:hypothetical protein